MSLTALSDSIFVQITFDFLNHLNLLATVVKGDGVRVASSKEDLEDFERIAVEGIAGDLSFTVCKRKAVINIETSKGVDLCTYSDSHSSMSLLRNDRRLLSIELKITNGYNLSINKVLKACILLTSGEHFEGLADLTELEVSLSHVRCVLQRVVGDGENAELLRDVLVAGISVDAQRLVVILSHI